MSRKNKIQQEIAKTEEEIATLLELETKLKRRERRKKICRFVVAGVSFLVVASCVAAHCTGLCKRK